MTNIEIAKSVLDTVQSGNIPFIIYCTTGGKFPDSWEDLVDIKLTREQRLYLISQELKSIPELFEGIQLEKIELYPILHDLALEGAWPDGLPEDYDDYEYDGLTYYIDKYVEGYAVLISKIMKGEIEQNDLPKWLAFFDALDKENNFYELQYLDIEDWVTDNN